jgi:hypothetical protein
VAETPEQLWERARDALRMPPVQEWRSWPFDGELRPRELQAPVERERPRAGEGGVDCFQCGRPDDEYLWTNERWRVATTQEPTGLPVVVFLEPRVHCDFGSIPDELVAELGPMLVRVEAAVRLVPHVGRVHVCRWGDGSEHLHWWFMARPLRLPQVIGTLAAIWDDILPPTPEDVWRENLATVVQGLSSTQ